MIGIGLIATPIASGSTSLIACRTIRSSPMRRHGASPPMGDARAAAPSVALTRCEHSTDARHTRSIPWPASSSRARSPSTSATPRPTGSPTWRPKAKEGAPNVLLIAWDDLGFATMDIYGGPVECPTMRRIAERGVVFSNFHTTALCSPTRASLLTGRNATTNGMATIAEFSSGFPGISTRIPFESGMISEVLAENGYNTYCVGKWHLTPGEEINLAAYKGRWPLGRGFERFYGYLGGEANSWYPDLVHDNHQIEAPGHARGGLPPRRRPRRQGRQLHPGRQGHRPRQAVLHVLRAVRRPRPAPRAEGVGRQVPGQVRPGLRGDPRRASSPARRSSASSPTTPSSRRSTRTASRSAPAPTASRGRCSTPCARGTPPVDDEKKLFARMAEVFAGYIAYYDDRIGRIIDYLEESGQLDNTIIVVVSDNGASGEGGPNGTFNEWEFFNGIPSTTERTLPHIDELGTPASNNHYNTGWAWALDTPFPYWKRWAGYEGGCADMMLVSWPAKIAASKEIRHQYCHAVDVVPTIYDLLEHRAARGDQGLPAVPASRARASPPRSPTRRCPGKSTQFYAMLGQRSLYHEGWLATTMHPPLAGWGNFEKDEWELYHLETDRAQSKNLAADEPERLELMKGLWFYYAGRYNGLPLDDRSALEQVLADRPRAAAPRDRTSSTRAASDVPESRRAR